MGSIEEMVAGTDRGLLLTCMWYIRVVDPQTALLTGLTRDGVYLVEQGEITAAVNNFRWNESPSTCCGASGTPRREWNEPRVGRRLLLAHCDARVAGTGINMSSVSPAQ